MAPSLLSPLHPATLAVLFANLPRQLRPYRQWVAWKWQRRTSASGQVKWSKRPYTPRTMRPADTTDPATWGTYRDAVAAYKAGRCAGIGFAMAPGDPFVGVDLDDCRDPSTGEITGWARAIIDRLASYWEVSPSGTGAKIWVCAKLPPTGHRSGGIEIYDRAQFFTLTGHVPDGVPRAIEVRQDAVDALCAQLFGADGGLPVPQPADTDEREREAEMVASGGPITPGADARAALAKAQSKRNALFSPLKPEHRRLISSTGPDGYSTPSEADMGAITALAWRLTPSETYAVMLESARGLDMIARDKGGGYLRASIVKAYAIVRAGRANGRRARPVDRGR